MIEQDVLDCLDHALSRHGRPPRIDTAALMLGDFTGLIVQFEKRANKVIKQINNHVPAESRVPTYAFFCEDEAYGAFALADRYNYVVLNLGIVPALTHFCQRMMATQGLWPKVRSVEFPNCCVSPSTKDVPAYFAWKVQQSRIPDDSLRKAVAVIFMSECFDLIVHHELAHLVLGHHRVAKDDPLVRQALEFVADGHAAIWGFGRLARFPKIPGDSARDIDKGYCELFGTSENSMRNYLLATFFVFRLMDEITWTNKELVSRGHPPAPMRFHTVCIHLDEHYQRMGDSATLDRLHKAVPEVWELGEIIFGKSLDREPDQYPMREVMSVESEKHYELVSNCAQTLPRHLFGLA
jgi:hypothetical protein